MSGSDQKDPLQNQEMSSPGAPIEDQPGADLFAEPPDFVLPAIPIAPPKAINAPASRALASGDHLLDFVRDPRGQESSKPAQRISIPDDIEPELFANLLPSDSNRTVSPPPSAIAPGDRLTQALRPAVSESEPNSPLEQHPAPDFPITPFAPFTAPLHAEPVHDNAAPTVSAPGAPAIPRPSAEWVGINEPQPSIPPPAFRLQPEPESRIPNFGHLSILIVIAFLGLVAAGLAVGTALHFHLWGVTTTDKAATDIHYTLASMAVLYVVSFCCAFFLFPRLWHKPFFAGLQWNARAAVRYRHWLFGAAGFCFILALVDEFLLPGPTSAPIDKMFSNTSAAWLLFGFGVLVAPFFEEMTFRGFLLPALCTTCDWVSEYVASERQWSRPALIAGSAVASSALAAFCERRFGHNRPVEWLLVSCFVAVVCGLAFSWFYQRYHAVGADSRVRPLGPNGHPQWSLAAMIVASLLTSLPFAAMHAEQIAHSFGPLLLLYCVSLILCFARLATRSLAASTLVHASYNFILFALMLVGTGGFKHLDKM